MNTMNCSVSSPMNHNLTVTTSSNTIGGFTPFPGTITSITGADASLHVKGNATIEGNLTVGGEVFTESLDKRLVKIEERLCILNFNEQLETRWAALRELRIKYMELEQDCLEKEQIIRMLKGEKA